MEQAAERGGEPATQWGGRSGKEGQRGISLVEVIVAMFVAGIALAVFTQTVKPTIHGNKTNRKYIDITAGLSEVLDSAMTQPVAALDGMNGKVYRSRQGVDVKVSVSLYTQAQADGLMPGLDISRMRKITVKAVADTLRALSGTVSNYQELANGKCFL
jgi:prepilin-type N-terminal cleavage/methylation domain-containing protein